MKNNIPLIGPAEFSFKLGQTVHWGYPQDYYQVTANFEMALYCDLAAQGLLRIPDHFGTFAPAKRRRDIHCAWMVSALEMIKYRASYADLDAMDQEWLTYHCPADVACFFTAGQLAGSWWWVGRYEAVVAGGATEYEEATLNSPYDGPVILSRLDEETLETIRRRVHPETRMWLKLIER